MTVNRDQSVPDEHEILASTQAHTRPTPNSSRKLLHLPNLSRQNGSPSHRSKMSTLFGQAASSLLGSAVSSQGPRYNKKAARMPSIQNRFTRFGEAHCDDIEMTTINEPIIKAVDNVSSIEHCEENSDVVHNLQNQDRPQASNEEISEGRVLYPLIDPPSPPIRKCPFAAAVALQEKPGISYHSYVSQAQEPISSGFGTPEDPRDVYFKTPSACKDRNVGDRRMHEPMSLAHPDSESEEHSSHGVRLTMPYTCGQAQAGQQANIDAWLEQLLSAGTDTTDPAVQSGSNEPFVRGVLEDIVLPGEEANGVSFLDSEFESAGEYQSSSYYSPMSHPSSNKENIPPGSRPRPPPPSFEKRPPKTSALQSPTRPMTTLSRPSASVRKESHTTSLGGQLSAPPRRKKARVIGDAGPPFRSVLSKPQDHTVCDEDLTAALATLSPSVERHRKAHRPKKERCASFFDTDVFGPGTTVYPVQGPYDALGNGTK